MADTAKVQRRCAALDTCVLFHLAEDHAPSHNLVRRLIRQGLVPIATQTVVQELAHFESHGPTERKRLIARKALTSMLSWGVAPGNLKPVGNAICEVVCERFFKAKLLPDTEVNDACVIIEASFYGVVCLTSWDHHILGADNKELNRILRDADLNEIQIRRPSEILGYEA